jgi:hypothetical protein
VPLTVNEPVNMGLCIIIFYGLGYFAFTA